MKVYYYILLLLPFFVACSQDESGMEVVNSEVCKDVVLTTSFNVSQGDKQVNTRAWDNGTVGSDELPIDTYPFEKLYMIVERSNGSSESLEFPITTNAAVTPQKVMMIRMYYKEGNSNVLYVQARDNEGGFPEISDNDFSIDLGSDKVYFSSRTTDVGVVELTSIQSEEKEGNVYKPMGDILFRSNYINLSIDDSGINIGDASICSQDNFTIELNRCTAVVSGYLIVTGDTNEAIDENEDGQPDYEDYNLSASEFNKKMGDNPSQWSSRFYMQNFPLEYQMKSEGDFEQALGNVKSAGTKGTVMLSEDWEAFSNSVSYSDLVVSSENNNSYDGVGGGDASFPFIYWVDGTVLNELSTNLVVCVKHDETVKFLHVPIGTHTIAHNSHTLLVIIVRVSDLAKGFGINATTTSSSLRSGSDILDIPYKVVTKSNPL